MTYRRSTRLYLLPLVVIAMSVVIAVTGGGAAALAGAVIFYWIITAIADYTKRLTVAPDRLEMRGYFGGPIVINRQEARLCKYVSVRAQQRSLEIAFLEIADTSSHHLKVWRYGWNRQSRELFAALQEWLASSPAVVTPEAQRVLSSRARLSSPAA
jgi:hypothetical protein